MLFQFHQCILDYSHYMEFYKPTDVSWLKFLILFEKNESSFLPHWKYEMIFIKPKYLLISLLIKI